MPFSKRSQPKSRTSKRFRRRYRKKATKSTTRFGSGPLVLPDRLPVKMKYSAPYTLTSASTVPSLQVMRLSSLYDPDFTGTGNQPLGRDQWAAFYKTYRTYFVKYSITFINTSTTEQAFCAVIPKNTSSGIASIDLICEKPYSKHTFLGIEGSGKNVRTIHGTASARKALGMSKLEYNSEKATSADFGANPGTEAYLHVYAGPAFGSNSTTVKVRLTVTYYSILSNRVGLNGS